MHDPGTLRAVPDVIRLLGADIAISSVQSVCQGTRQELKPIPGKLLAVLGDLATQVVIGKQPSGKIGQQLPCTAEWDVMHPGLHGGPPPAKQRAACIQDDGLYRRHWDQMRGSAARLAPEHAQQHLDRSRCLDRAGHLDRSRQAGGRGWHTPALPPKGGADRTLWLSRFWIKFRIRQRLAHTCPPSKRWRRRNAMVAPSSTICAQG